jgi:hypothetical protein
MNPTKEILDDIETFKQQQVKLIYTTSSSKIIKKEDKGKTENKIVSKKLKKIFKLTYQFFTEIYRTLNHYYLKS